MSENEIENLYSHYYIRLFTFNIKRIKMVNLLFEIKHFGLVYPLDQFNYIRKKEREREKRKIKITFY